MGRPSSKRVERTVLGAVAQLRSLSAAADTPIRWAEREGHSYDFLTQES